MKLRCQREDLLQALSALVRLMPARTTNLEILNGTLLFTREGKLVLQGTDLEQSLTLEIPAAIEEEGSTVVPTRYLLDLTRHLPQEEIYLSWNDLNNQLEIRYGKASVNLNTWLAADFPAVQPRPVEHHLTLEGACWKRMIKKVLFAAAPQGIRPQLAGVYFLLNNGKIYLVATDTYRLAVLTRPYQGEPEGQGVLVPAATLAETARLTGDQDRLEITWDAKLVSFQTAAYVLTGRLIAGRFPDYEQVIPKSSKLELELDRLEFLGCLERASLFVAPPEHFAVTELTVNGQTLEVAAQAAQVGSLKEEITLEQPAGNEEKVSFNNRFLLEPLKAMDQARIKVLLNGPGGPLVYQELGEENYMHIVLPVCRAQGAA